MKYRPILFSTPMVQALLDGRKTMTRRIVKGKTEHFACIENSDDGTAVPYVRGAGAKLWPEPPIKCPYGKVGDVLWVREKWAYMNNTYDNKPMGYYHSTDIYCGKWKPSIHMPKKACRLWLEITAIRVEPLQTIMPWETVQEGIEGYDGSWKDYLTGGRQTYRTNSFISLWKSINGEHSWNENPWVWVIEFKRVDKPTNFI